MNQNLQTPLLNRASQDTQAPAPLIFLPLTPPARADSLRSTPLLLPSRAETTLQPAVQQLCRHYNTKNMFDNLL